MVSINPDCCDIYYIRMLLTQRADVYSFEDLKTIDDKVYDTYKAACIVMKLLQDDTEWEQCLKEAVAYQMPQALRNLFITILTMCNPSQPLELYNQFKSNLMEDFVHKLKNNRSIFPEEELLQRASTMLLRELDKSFA